MTSLLGSHEGSFPTTARSEDACLRGCRVLPAAPVAAFTSLPKPRFAFLLSVFCLCELVSERAPLMLPEAIFQTRLKGLVEILRYSRRKQNTAKQGFRQMQTLCIYLPNPAANSVHLPSKSSCSAGTGGQPQLRVRWGRGKLNAERSLGSPQAWVP